MCARESPHRRIRVFANRDCSFMHIAVDRKPHTITSSCDLGSRRTSAATATPAPATSSTTSTSATSTTAAATTTHWRLLGCRRRSC